MILFSFAFLNSEATLIRKSKWKQTSVLVGAAKQFFSSIYALISLRPCETTMTTHREHRSFPNYSDVTLLGWKRLKAFTNLLYVLSRKNSSSYYRIFQKFLTRPYLSKPPGPIFLLIVTERCTHTQHGMVGIKVKDWRKYGGPLWANRIIITPNQSH